MATRINRRKAAQLAAGATLAATAAPAAIAAVRIKDLIAECGRAEKTLNDASERHEAAFDAWEKTRTFRVVMSFGSALEVHGGDTFPSDFEAYNRQNAMKAKAGIEWMHGKDTEAWEIALAAIEVETRAAKDRFEKVYGQYLKERADSGLGDAERELTEADKAYTVAVAAVYACPCHTAEDWNAKADFIEEQGGRIGDICNDADGLEFDGLIAGLRAQAAT